MSIIIFIEYMKDVIQRLPLGGGNGLKRGVLKSYIDDLEIRNDVLEKRCRELQKAQGAGANAIDRPAPVAPMILRSPSPEVHVWKRRTPGFIPNSVIRQEISSRTDHVHNETE